MMLKRRIAALFQDRPTVMGDRRHSVALLTAVTLGLMGGGGALPA